MDFNQLDPNKIIELIIEIVKSLSPILIAYFSHRYRQGNKKKVKKPNIINQETVRTGLFLCPQSQP